MTKTFKLTPDLTCPELAGYRLPPCSRGQEDGVEIPQSFGNSYQNYAFGEGYKSGYNKAREKYEFSREDLVHAIDLAQEMHKPKYCHDYEHTYTPEQIMSILRTPIAIEVEMEKVKVNPMGRIVDPMNVAQNQSSCKWEDRPALNPDGTVKGRYIYE